MQRRAPSPNWPPGIPRWQCCFTDSLPASSGWVSAAQRAEQPQSDETAAVPAQYVYGAYVSSWIDDETGDHLREVCALRVIRKTGKRIFYARPEHCDVSRVLIGFIGRLPFERDGEIRTRHYHQADYHLFADRAAAEAYVWPNRDADADTADLRELRLAMGEAHPDRGGTAEQFTEARERYLRAKGA